jgi:hypothetical protein
VANLKSLNINVYHVKVLEKLYMTDAFDLTNLCIKKTGVIDFETVNNIIEAQPNLRSLEIHKIEESSLAKTLSLNYLTQLTVSIEVYDDLQQELMFPVLKRLSIKYFMYSMDKIRAPQITSLRIQPYRFTQRELDKIVTTFTNLIEFAVVIYQRKVESCLNFTECIEKLTNLESLEISDAFYHKVFDGLFNIIIYNHKDIENMKKFSRLKTLKLNQIFAYETSLEAVFEKCPFIEHLSFLNCGFYSTIEITKLVCKKLSNLRTIAYTPENIQGFPAPLSAKLLLDRFCYLEKIEFVPPAYEKNVRSAFHDAMKIYVMNVGPAFNDAKNSVHSLRLFYENLKEIFDVVQHNEDIPTMYNFPNNEEAYFESSSDSGSDIEQFIRVFNENYKRGQDEVIEISSDSEDE